jgi:hypothetical protein
MAGPEWIFASGRQESQRRDLPVIHDTSSSPADADLAFKEKPRELLRFSGRIMQLAE